MQRDDILAALRRTAQDNGGKPLGMARFARVSGIGTYDWSKYWPRFSDLQREAGFEPNKLTSAFADDYLLDRLAGLVREINHFPIKNELTIRRHHDPTFPSKDAYERLGNKDQLISRVFAFCQGKREYVAVVRLLEPLVKPKASITTELTDLSSKESRYGFVYLIKERPGHYKIGASDDPDRRVYELTKGPYKYSLESTIQTDDPYGVEAYWHKRYEGKAKRGEWYILNAADVKAFKRWKRIY